MAVKPIREGSIDGVWGYLSSIDWEEPWLWALIAFHVLCTALVTLTALLKRQSMQAFLFVTYLGIVYCAEYINEWAANNWKMFAGQQYFDSQGLFISIVMSGPLLLNCLIIVVLWLYDTTKLLFSVAHAKAEHTRSKAARDIEKKKDS